MHKLRIWPQQRWNNTSKAPVHDYDIVIGPIADDRVGLQLWRYETRSIDLPTLVHNLQYMKGVTIQYFFGTERAINTFKKTMNEVMEDNTRLYYQSPMYVYSFLEQELKSGRIG